MRVVGLVLLAVACASPPVPNAGPQVDRYHATRSPHVYATAAARRSLDSLFRWSVANRVETGACIASYSSFTDSIGTVVFVRKVIAGDIKAREFARIWWTKGLCDDSLPSVHTHWYDSGPECPLCNRWVPSEPDSESARLFPRIPFHLVVVDTGNYVLLEIR